MIYDLRLGCASQTVVNSAFREKTVQKWPISAAACRFSRLYGALTGKTDYFCVIQNPPYYATWKKQRTAVAPG